MYAMNQRYRGRSTMKAPCRECAPPGSSTQAGSRAAPGCSSGAQRRLIRTMTPAATARTARMTPLPVKRTCKSDIRPPATNHAPRRILPVCVPVFSLLSAKKNRMPVTIPNTARMMPLFEKETRRDGPGPSGPARCQEECSPRSS